MSKDKGASTSSTGLSPSVEPASGLDGSATSIPSTERAELHQFRLDALESLMSDISEGCWCAGWLIGNEHSLYRIVFEDAPRRYGMSEVSDDEVARLRLLAAQTGSWFHWPEAVRDGPVRIDLSEFAQAIEARRAETGTGSVEDESAVGAADAPGDGQQ